MAYGRNTAINYGHRGFYNIEHWSYVSPPICSENYELMHHSFCSWTQVSTITVDTLLFEWWPEQRLQYYKIMRQQSHSPLRVLECLMNP